MKSLLAGEVVLNCKDYEGRASYRTYKDFTCEWTGRGASAFKKMSTEVTPNAGIEFIFPQSANGGQHIENQMQGRLL